MPETSAKDAEKHREEEKRRVNQDRDKRSMVYMPHNTDNGRSADHRALVFFVNANIDRVKQEMTEYELIPVDWGGSTEFVPVSAPGVSRKVMLCPFTVTV